MQRDPVQGILDSTRTRRVPQNYCGFLARSTPSPQICHKVRNGPVLRHEPLIAATFFLREIAVRRNLRLRPKMLERGLGNYGGCMANRNRILKTLSLVLPAGAFGASVLLALAATEAGAATGTNPQTSTTPQQSISTRLQTIRAGVSDMSGSAGFDPEGDATATPAWWGNGGWGRWRAGWGNGGWGWHNGGWGNGGWHNGGWGNGGWGNGGWGNGGWHNGWHNFWHNW